MIYDILPVPKPRMTRGDKFRGKGKSRKPTRPGVARYWAYKDECRIRMPADLDLNLKTIIFYLPMPASWKKEKKNMMQHQPHLQTPDLSNLLKALEDALYGNDSHIWNVHPIKKWDYKGSIEII